MRSLFLPRGGGGGGRHDIVLEVFFYPWTVTVGRVDFGDFYALRDRL